MQLARHCACTKEQLFFALVMFQKCSVFTSQFQTEDLEGRKHLLPVEEVHFQKTNSDFTQRQLGLFYTKTVDSSSKKPRGRIYWYSSVYFGILSVPPRAAHRVNQTQCWQNTIKVLKSNLMYWLMYIQLQNILIVMVNRDTNFKRAQNCTIFSTGEGLPKYRPALSQQWNLISWGHVAIVQCTNTSTQHGEQPHILKIYSLIIWFKKIKSYPIWGDMCLSQTNFSFNLHPSRNLFFCKFFLINATQTLP